MNTEALDTAIRYINSWLAFRFSQLELPGFVVAIRHKDKLLYNQAFGCADLERKVAMRPEHIFRIASHSKMFTATAVLQLQEQGKLRLDEPAIVYAPWLKDHPDERWSNVTIRQLLCHGAGVIRDGLDCDYWAVERPFPDAEEFKHELLRAELVIENNTKLKYSNYGYTLLGVVIETASEQDYHQYVKQHIINPLRLSNTGPEYEKSMQDNLAIGYTRRDVNKRRLPIDHVDTRAMAAATGFCATAEDLCAFAAAHFWDSEQLLQLESKKEMQRIHWSGQFAGERDEYGLGFVIEDVDGRRLAGHSGGFPGYITKTVFDSKDELAVVVLTNCIDGEARDMNLGIVRVIDWFQKHHTDKSSHDLSRFEGRFMNLWGVIDIVSSGNRIIAAEPASWTPFKDAEELAYINENTLKITDASSFGSEDELIRYVFDKNGVVKKITKAGSTKLPEREYMAKMKHRSVISLT